MDEQRHPLISDERAARLVAWVRRWWPGRDGPTARTAMIVGLVVLGLLIIVVFGFVRASPQARQAPTYPALASASSSAPAPTNAVAAAGSSAPSMVVVSVVGKVAHPGLVHLPPGSRVADAIAAAGGPLGDLNTAQINLARQVTDGEQLFVGVPVPAWARGQTAMPQPATSAAGTGTTGSDGASASAPGGKVNLNTANADQLEDLPGIGEVTAKRILDWRQQHGGFHTIAQLKDVSGIGDGKFSQLKDLVTVQ